MSYLGPLRLHFAGQFQADPSTVNNAVGHFDTARFKPEDAERYPSTSWRPAGTGAFRLLGCRVTAVSYSDGTFSRQDSVVGMYIGDADARVSGKIVDLDPQQQLVSQLWGLTVRLTDGARDLFNGPFEVASSSDLWGGRALARGAPGDTMLSTFYQSVIGPVVWGDTRHSKLLTQLRRAAREGMLSIKFNLDGFNMNASSPTYTLGRIAGTIGPWSPNEPKHFVLGRQLLPHLNGQSPAGQMNFMPAVVDRSTRRIIADFGNALPTSHPGGPMHDIGDVQLGYIEKSGGFHSLGRVHYRKKNWYLTTAGIQTFPYNRKLTSSEWRALESHRIAISQNGDLILRESHEGLYARADRTVFRLQPGETATAEIWASQYGKPLPRVKLAFFHDTSGFQPSGEGSSSSHDPPAFGIPKHALTFPKTLRTGRNGRAVLKLTSSNPGNPRAYVDGQIYGVRWMIREIAERVKKDPSFGWNPTAFINVRVFDAFRIKLRPTWHDLQPIFDLYGNLFPVMSHIVDLHSYDSVVANARLLLHAFSLPVDDPNYMPVTRDLSDAKREAILRWLKNPIRGKEPKKPRAHKQPIAFVKDRPPAPAVTGAKTVALDTRGTLRIPDDL